MPTKSPFEGPLRPGRGEDLKPPRLRPPNPIRVPRSPITNPRDLLPPCDSATNATKLAVAEKKRIEKNAYRRGRAKGFAVGYDAGFAAGEAFERNNLFFDTST